MIKLKSLLKETTNPVIRKLAPKYAEILRKKGYQIGGDGAGGIVVVKPTGKTGIGTTISGPWSDWNLAVWYGADKAGLISPEDKATLKNYRWR